MDRFAVVLLASAIGAAGGVLGVRALAPEKPVETEEATPDLPSDLSARLERIEAQLSQRSQPLTLQGSGRSASGLSADSPEGKALIDAIAVRVGETTREALAAGGTSAALGEAPVPAPVRVRPKRMKLTDVARELELSSAEEQALQEIYEKSNESMMKALAGEDGDIETVRKDLEKVRENPEEGMLLMMKYVPRVMKDPSKLFSLRSEQDKAVKEAIGEDKSQRLKREFVVEEADPFGLQRAGRRRFR